MVAAEQDEVVEARSRRPAPSGRCDGHRRSGGVRSPGTDSGRRARAARGGPTAGSSGFVGRRRAARRRVGDRGTSEQSQARRRAVSAAIPGPSAIAHAPRPVTLAPGGSVASVAASTWTQQLVTLAAREPGRWSGEGAPRTSAASDSALVGDGGGGSGGSAEPPRLIGSERFRGTVRASPSASAHPLLVQRVASRFERAQEERAVLGRQLRVDVQAAVVVIPVPAQEALAVRLVGLGRRAPDAPRAPCARVGPRSRGARARAGRPRSRRSATRVSARTFE